MLSSRAVFRSMDMKGFPRLSFCETLKVERLSYTCVRVDLLIRATNIFFATSAEKSLLKFRGNVWRDGFGGKSVTMQRDCSRNSVQSKQRRTDEKINVSIGKVAKQFVTVRKRKSLKFIVSLALLLLERAYDCRRCV